MRRMMIVLLGGSLLAFAALAAARPPWLLTDGERIAARVDPRNVSERVRAHRDSAEGGVSAPYVIDGQRNPELFLPTELVAFLATQYFVDERTRSAERAGYAPVLASLQTDATAFWSDFDAAIAEYVTLVREPATGAHPGEKSRSACAARVAALNAMRTKYPRFDEFLYTAVAPRRSIAYSQPEDPQWLALVSRGCK
jgi:hypothetical protein